MMGQAHRIKRGKLMNTIGIALISFGVGLIISLKLMKEDEKKPKLDKLSDSINSINSPKYVSYEYRRYKNFSRSGKRYCM